MVFPPVQDAVYGYQVTNVEAALKNSTSLLHWSRRMIEVRKQNPAFGLGTLTDLGGSNPSVFAFVRRWEGPEGVDTVLCVNNLSRSAQAVELDLRSYEGVQPVEVLGGAHFPRIGELPYLLTMAGHGFYWFRLDPAAAP
jgi:maltose alpha-D-glucosyltransferase/alpha-amylase